MWAKMRHRLHRTPMFVHRPVLPKNLSITKETGTSGDLGHGRMSEAKQKQRRAYATHGSRDFNASTRLLLKFCQQSFPDS